jgi:hypothetical protein
MKFTDFYEDLVVEEQGRPMSDEKFEALTTLMGKWIFDEVESKPNQVSRVPFFSELKQFAKDKSGPGENADDIDQLVLMIQPDPNEQSNLMYDWLNQMPQLKAQKFMRSVQELFPNIATKVRYYDKPEGWQPSGRGRKIGSKNKPKTPRVEVPSISTSPVTPTTVEPSLTVEPETSQTEKGKRGRKPGLTPKTVDRISQNLYKVHTNMENQLAKMKNLMDDLIMRKDFFGKQ